MAHALLKKFAVAAVAAAPALAASQTSQVPWAGDNEIGGRLTNGIHFVKMFEPRMGLAKAELASGTVQTMIGRLAAKAKADKVAYIYDGMEDATLANGVAKVFAGASGTPGEPYYGCYQFREKGAPAATVEGVFSIGPAYRPPGMMLTRADFTRITPPANLTTCKQILNHLTGGAIAAAPAEQISAAPANAPAATPASMVVAARKPAPAPGQ
jgi:hypothetical protein